MFITFEGQLNEERIHKQRLAKVEDALLARQNECDALRAQNRLNLNKMNYMERDITDKENQIIDWTKRAISLKEIVKQKTSQIDNMRNELKETLVQLKKEQRNANRCWRTMKVMGARMEVRTSRVYQNQQILKGELSCQKPDEVARFACTYFEDGKPTTNQMKYIDKELKATQFQLEMERNNSKRLCNENDALNKIIDEERKGLDKERSNIEKLEHDLKKLQNALEASQSSCKEIEANGLKIIKQKNSEIDELRQQLKEDVLSLQSERNVTKGLFHENEKWKRHVKEQNNTLDKYRSQLKDDVNRLQKAFDDTQNSLKDTEAKLTARTIAYDTRKKLHEFAMGKLLEKNTEFKQTTQLIETLQDQNIKLKKEIDNAENIISLNRIHYRKSEDNYVKHISELEHG